MHDLHFLQDLAVVMIVAAVVTVLFRQFRQPVVLGYILAGVIIGPHTPPFSLLSNNEHTIETLSHLGVIFLMFSLGLEFSLRKLKAVGATAFIAATLEIVLMVFTGYWLGQIFGWKPMDCIFLGAILAISSTTIIVKALEELGQTKERFARLIFGILVVEDILAILMIALLSGFAVTGSLAVADIGQTVLKLSAFLGVLLVGGLIVVPRLLNYVARFKSNEMLLVTVVGLCFGVSILAVKLGYSVALGAFLIGAIIAEARQIAKIEGLMHPVRDLFSAVFFVSIGLLIDPSVLWQYKWPILFISIAVIVGKVFTCGLGTFLAGNEQRTSLRVGMGLAQIGEFSFIIAALGEQLNVTSKFLYPIAVAVSAVTTLTTPYLMRASDAVANGFDRLAPQSLANALDTYTRWVGQAADSKPGPAARLLRQWGLQIALNVLLIAGVFLTASGLRGRLVAWWPSVPGGLEGGKALLWLAAMILSLPLFIAAIRKLQAMGMLVGEVSVRRAVAKEKTEAFRAIISTTVVVAGSLALVLLVLGLSSTILPSREILFFLVLLLAVTAVLLRRTFIRLHSRAQAALHETFEQVPEPHQPAPSTPQLPALLREAQLRLTTISASSPAAGKMISELGLRTATGASIVGIERTGENIVNPGPDEELRVEDRVLLIGSTAQLTAAEALLA
jgi:CPA2 family monovalent cation:H+ antiporter-2